MNRGQNRKMLYIQFRPSMITDQLLRDLEQARDQLDPYARLLDEFTGELRRHALAETIHYSTRIEGNTLTFQQVQSLLSGGSADAPQAQVQEVHNYREAISYVQSLVVDRYPTITEETIRTIHYLVSKSLPGDYSPGKYRTIQNFVVDRISQRRLFLPPIPEKVPELMKDFVAWVNTRDELPTVYKAALAHLNLVAVHPFVDGNGRTARVLDSLVMYQGGFRSQDLVSLEAYFGKDTQGYYNALSSALGSTYSPQRDVSAWINYYLEAHTKQAQAAVQVVRQMEAEWNGVEAALKDEGFSPWQIGTLWLTLRRGRMTNREYRGITGRSSISAWSDLRRLVESGWLVSFGRGRNVVYAPSTKAKDLYEEIRGRIDTTWQ